MRIKLTKAVVGLGLAGALLLGAGVAAAPAAGDQSSSSTATTTAQNAQQSGQTAATPCPDQSE
jgi:hypothetical protein